MALWRLFMNEIQQAKSDLQDEILEHSNIAHYLSHSEFENLAPEEHLKYNETKMRAEDLTGLNRGSDVIEIVAKLRRLVDNKKELLGL